MPGSHKYEASILRLLLPVEGLLTVAEPVRVMDAPGARSPVQTALPVVRFKVTKG